MSIISGWFHGDRSSQSPAAPKRDDDADEARPPSQPLPIVTSIASDSTTASGVHLPSSQSVRRGPARSYISQSVLSNNDSPHYSSQNVREESKELASWTFSHQDTQFKPTGQVPRHLSFSSIDSVTRGESSTAPAHRENRSSAARKPSSEIARPDIIEEVSEPSTPVAVSSSKKPSLLRQDSALTSMFKRRKSPPPPPDQGQDGLLDSSGKDIPWYTSKPLSDLGDEADEQTPLLLGQGPEAKARSVPHEDDLEFQAVRPRYKQTQLRRLIGEAAKRTSQFYITVTSPKSWSARAVWDQGVKLPISFLPCVFLGLLLNVLDGLSYGMILFPLGEPIFSQTGPDGLSMFYLSCIISQLVFSFGGSAFKGAVGSEMIEVVPFFHKMTNTIIARTGRDQPNVLLATTFTAYAISSIITGMVFFLLGSLRLGSLVSFFPRHILIGCIGGVGFFLLKTGVEVSSRLEGNFSYNLDTAKKLFSKDTAPLWTIPLGLALVLLLMKRFINSPYLVPAFFIGVVVVFYIIVTAVTALNVPDLRGRGWIFPEVKSNLPFYHFYTYYQFGAVDWKAVASTVPAMFALTFFGILHVPINIPALAIAAQEDDVNLNRELVAHGISNALSGFVGSIQNYLVYVNSEMFMSNGGNHRVAGFMLALATFAVWAAGPTMIGYVPIMVVGALIFYLAIALLEEALYDTWGRMNRLEYLTVVAIILVMGIYDFVAGVLVGIVLACLNFVVQTSQKSAIRATYSGEIVESTVRRHPVQRHFLREVGYQIYVTKLAGFLFFGSIVRVEKSSRALIEEEAFRRQPIRYLIFDLRHVNGIDYSAVEAFSRIERVLGRRDVRMIVSGVQKEDDVGQGLRAVGLWSDDSSVEFFENLNTALEYCENELLKALYYQRDQLNTSEQHKSSVDVPKLEQQQQQLEAPVLASLTADNGKSMASSPRRMYLQRAASTTLDSSQYSAPSKWTSLKQPLPLILQTFQNLTEKGEDFWFQAVGYFERVEYTAGTIVYSHGEKATCFYLLYSGLLRASYTLPQGSYHESILAGTTCGELPFFSSTDRTATVVAERDSVAWRLTEKNWNRMQQEWPQGAAEVLRVALKLTKERVDAVTSYVLTAAG